MQLGQNLFVTAGTVAAPVALDAAADVLSWTPPVAVKLLRFGVIVTVALDNTATPLILSLDTNDLLASAVRTERATLTEPAVDAVVGAVRYRDLPAFTMFTGLPSNVVLAGVQVILEVKQAAVAGDGIVWAEYTPLQRAVDHYLPVGNVHIPVERTS